MDWGGGQFRWCGLMRGWSVIVLIYILIESYRSCCSELPEQKKQKLIKTETRPGAKTENPRPNCFRSELVVKTGQNLIFESLIFNLNSIVLLAHLATNYQ